MQALSMIDMGARAPETVVPGEPAEIKGQEFGKVLNDQQQPAEKPQVVKAAKSEEPPAPRAIADQAVAQDQSSANANDALHADGCVALQAAACSESQAEVKVQQIVVNLLKAIAHDESAETAEAGGSIEELLTQLVEQLDSSELKGEQVLAGIDLSALVEQLQELSEMQINPELQEAIELQDGEKPLDQLVSQLVAQLAGEAQSNANFEGQQTEELATGVLSVAKPQASGSGLGENLKQARRILQQAIDSVKAQQPAEKQVELRPVEIQAQPVEQELLADEASEEIDPRFSGLLKPRTEGRFNQQSSLREQVQGSNLQQNSAQPGLAKETAQAVTELNPEQAKVAEFAELLGSNPKQAMENLVQQAQGNLQQAGTQANQPLASANARLMPDVAATVQLPSGQQVAESQIFDQVVARVSGSFNGESGRMVLRLQPAELGSLRLELMVEGDRVRASLQAQSLQVQEVLERNLPQLRNALAEQGLKIDQFQVDVNQQQNQQSQFDNLAQQQQHKGSQRQPGWQQPFQPEEQIVPLAHLMQNGGGGISLHV